MNLLFPFASLGVINGIVVALYLLIKKQRTITDAYFSGMILAFCVRIGKSVLLFYTDSADSLIKQIGLSACIFIGPFFYLYLKSLTKKLPTTGSGERLLLIVILGSILTVGIVFPYQEFPHYWNPMIVQVIYAVWILFVGLGLIQGYDLIGRNLFLPWRLKGDRRYLSGIVIAVTLITLTYQCALYFSAFTYIWGAFIFSGAFYVLGLRALLNKSVAAKPKLPPVEGGAQLMDRLDSIMANEQPFKDPGMKLDDLASKLDVSRHVLSQVLNQSEVSGYANYVRNYRVAEAKTLIASKTHLSLEGIGYEAGFRSKSAFFEAFKKNMHCTPAAYKKQLKITKESGMIG